MNKRWVLKEQGDNEKVRSLSKSLNISKNLAKLLVQRGIETFDEAKDFFRPDLNKLHDPFLMKDMDKAVERVSNAVRNNEKILVYGDYDVDGTTAVALIYSFLKEFYFNVDFYIPDRYAEGYGISIKGIDFAYQNGFTLIIALDCGIKAVEKIEYAKEKDIDFIICDHHRPGDKIPNAVAVLDPKRDDCNYPYDGLSGCGVGFKLAQAFASKNGIPFKNLKKYLDLVVVSIASDIVPITGENRTLAYFGLKLINSNPRPGFEAILYYSNIKRSSSDSGGYIFSKELGISDLVFLIGPRINAAGRIESAKNSVEILICNNLHYATRLAENIDSMNTVRRDLDNQTTEHALEMIKEDKILLNKKSTVVYHPGWHKGVIGIVASRLTDHYYRPTVVLTKSNGLITGSARSVKDFDVYEAIDSCSDLLEHFGGHKYAAGLALKPENLDTFIEKFEEIVSANIEEHMLTPEVTIDTKISISDIDDKFIRILKQFAPFGPGNMAPVFQSDGVVDTGLGRIVGNNHLKLRIADPNTGVSYDAIAFKQGYHLEIIMKKLPFKICYHIEENEWNGNVNLQLNIKDIKV